MITTTRFFRQAEASRADDMRSPVIRQTNDVVRPEAITVALGPPYLTTLRFPVSTESAKCVVVKPARSAARHDNVLHTGARRRLVANSWRANGKAGAARSISRSRRAVDVKVKKPKAGVRCDTTQSLVITIILKNPSIGAVRKMQSDLSSPADNVTILMAFSIRMPNAAEQQ